jgi:DNA repair protein RadA/Sms
MSKSSSVFVCQNCGASYPKWSGQCAQCWEWNSLVETVQTKTRGKSTAPLEISNLVTPFSEVEPASASKRRFSSGIGELDRVLGGGIVPGGVALIGGEPGIGKSTLLTQLVLQLLERSAAATDVAGSILYVCGEESPQQISLRISRILENQTQKNTDKKVSKLSKESLDRLLFVTTTDAEAIGQILEEQKPSLAIIDSIQTLSLVGLMGPAGSVGQIRETTSHLTIIAKRHHIPLFLVGHVTKEGAIAGPKILEHIVDTVLELSGERTGQLRLLRSVKNRFGTTDEVGVFQMVETGLKEVANPTELFLDQADQNIPGSALACVMEGTRPLLVEMQALVVSSQLSMPRRVGRGVELSRIQVLAAVLQKHCSLPLGTTDIFVSAAGGMSIREPSVDLSLAVAMASSHFSRKLPKNTVFIGEIGLLGEVRAVSGLEQRIKEAKRLGFTQIVSRQTHKRVKDVLKEFGLTN